MRIFGVRSLSLCNTHIGPTSTKYKILTIFIYVVCVHVPCLARSSAIFAPRASGNIRVLAPMVCLSPLTTLGLIVAPGLGNKAWPLAEQAVMERSDADPMKVDKLQGSGGDQLAR